MEQTHENCPQCGGKLSQGSGSATDDPKTIEQDTDGYITATGGPAMPTKIF